MICLIQKGEKTLSGIYMIRNRINGKFYIGSAKNFQKRFHHHLEAFRKKKHNSLFQNAWNKYGESAFSFFIIELCPTQLLIEREQFYLNLFTPYDRNIGYNICSNAYSRIGVKLSKEHTEKLKRRKVKPELRESISKNYIEKYGRFFTVKSPNGQIFTGRGSNQFARKNNLNVGNFNCMLRGEVYECMGWTLLNTSIYDKKRYKHWPEIFKFVNIKTGEILEFTKREIKKICNDRKLKQNKLINVWFGRIRSHLGYKKC